MAKSNLNRGSFGRSSAPVTAEQETAFVSVEPEHIEPPAPPAPPAPAPELKVVSEPAPAAKSAAVNNPTRVTLDDRQDLLNKIEVLEERVKTLENKLQTLVEILTKQMTGGLRGGPESLGRLLKSTEILKP